MSDPEGQPKNSKARKNSGPAPPPVATELLRPGLRLAVAVSGGADSVALLRLLAMEAPRLGLVLSVAHMHHGIRGVEADEDAAFVAELADSLGLRLFRRDVATPEIAQREAKGLEETARELRYGWFRELFVAGELDAVATAHTMSDQAETVLHKIVRGAWTEGLSGIHPVVTPGRQAAAEIGSEHGTPRGLIPGSSPGSALSLGVPSLQGSARASFQGPAPGNSLGGGRILRPLLTATRAEIVLWLEALRQPWREDSTNAELIYTRNRIRHQLLPELATYNPQVIVGLAQIATLARDEEEYWQGEVRRLLPGLLLPGRPVRGGGRASSTVPGERSLALEVDRLRIFHPALIRRLLRAAAQELGVALDFEQTARLVALVGERGSANPRREELTAKLRAERTPRELRLVWSTVAAEVTAQKAAGGIEIPVPGEGEGFGWRLRCSLSEGTESNGRQPNAVLRAAGPGDRVQLRHSRGAPKRVKEVLERMGISAPDRAGWPVLVWQGEIVWMAGAALEPTSLSGLLRVNAEPLTPSS